MIFIIYFSEIISYKRIKKDDLRLLTANLFFSMLPLHIENVKKARLALETFSFIDIL